MCRPTWYSDGTVTFVLVLEWHYNTWYSTGTVTCVLGTRLAILYNNYTVTRRIWGFSGSTPPK